MSTAYLPLVPCSECGDMDPAHHVYGAQKCCPDCRHNLAEHDRQVAERAWDEGHRAGCADPYARHGECDCGPNPYRADTLAPRPAAPGVSVSAEQVEAAARATLAPGVNPWSPRFRSGLHDFLAALGVTVTDGGA